MARSSCMVTPLLLMELAAAAAGANLAQAVRWVDRHRMAPL